MWRISVTAVSLAGIVATFSIPKYDLNQIQARSDRGGWSDTSDSSSGSLSSGSDSGGYHYIHADTKGRATITYKKKGARPLKTDVGPRPFGLAFSETGKARLKIQTHDENSVGNIELHGGKARMKVNSEKPSIAGLARGNDVYGRLNKKASHSEASTDPEKKGWARLHGKGKARVLIAPKRKPSEDP